MPKGDGHAPAVTGWMVQAALLLLPAPSTEEPIWIPTTVQQLLFVQYAMSPNQSTILQNLISGGDVPIASQFGITPGALDATQFADLAA